MGVNRLGKLLYRILGLNKESILYSNSGSTHYSLLRSNEIIKDAILAYKPFAISRLGMVESTCLLNYIEINKINSDTYLKKSHHKFQNYKTEWNENVKQNLCINAGFFPNSDLMISRFSDFFINQLSQIDAFGIWKFIPGEDYLINNYGTNPFRLDPIALEPYLFKDPWSCALLGKKVLVVHPFVDTIINQYHNKREKIFSNSLVLPEFEIKGVKAVQSIAGNRTDFKSWFEALDFMLNQISQHDFDVAIIGAGAYGLPISSYVKSLGKVAVHIGGATQILFGIKGKRWDNHPEISKMYNSYWVRPNSNEVVNGSEKVEGGCYW